MGAQKNIQRASSKKNSTTLQYLFDLDTKSSNKSNGNSISSCKSIIKQTSFEAENEELLSIISYCNVVFTFVDLSESPSQHDYKRIKLAELLSVVKAAKKPLDDRIVSPLISMLAVNLFRPLPPPSNVASSLADFPDDEDPMTSPIPSWPHLQIVYDILLRLVLNSDSKTLRSYIDHHFLLNLLYLFQSEDPRERDRLKNVYHRIYSKFTFYRSIMRKSMNDVFLYFIFETDRHAGIGELLEIWGSIINGFTVPLKEEHKLFLMRVLIPLHKPKGMQAYHRQLAYCVSQFVQKEPALGGLVVTGILRYWPITNCQKEVLLIGELEEMVESVDPEQYKQLAKPLCSQIVRCFNSWNSQVSERALYVWNNEHFVKMASQATEEVFPVVVEGIEKNLKWHWSKNVRQLTSSVKVMLEEMEPTLYSRCLRELELQDFFIDQEQKKRKQNWERIELAASQSQFIQQSNRACVSH
ncbi:hypothetical protein AQUCO_00700815v1 [Aquilegia coerulea]|uniref:Serine/threonine protein phosphatase 2A regulatory subunit n=1 Tax=Aquilegia coerulea TaxID=218851 RepID=A0A2G5EMD2_AQUCA|nr:hypothetical protein AQUCO_00700815v1 [Aquilegia coerulea]